MCAARSHSPGESGADDLVGDAIGDDLVGAQHPVTIGVVPEGFDVLSGVPAERLLEFLACTQDLLGRQDQVRDGPASLPGWLM